jgi:hypothetical protein
MTDSLSPKARLVDLVSRPVRILRAVPHVGTYLGLSVVAIGAMLIVLAWGKTAGLNDVGVQLPYVLSAGCTGLALIVVGLTAVDLSAKRADFAERAAQTTELRALIGELRRAIEAGVGSPTAEVDR